MTSAKREALIIADASPLILLSKVGRLDLLLRLADEVAVPRAVWEEIVAGGVTRPEVEELRRRFERCVADSDQILTAAYAVQVDEGEAAAMALAARSGNALLLIDDSRGRSIAKASGLRVLGTIGLLIRAKSTGLIPAIRPELEGLKRAGMFLDATLVQTALERAGELESE